MEVPMCFCNLLNRYSAFLLHTSHWNPHYFRIMHSQTHFFLKGFILIRLYRFYKSWLSDIWFKNWTTIWVQIICRYIAVNGDNTCKSKNQECNTVINGTKRTLRNILLNIYTEVFVSAASFSELPYVFIFREIKL